VLTTGAAPQQDLPFQSPTAFNRQLAEPTPLERAIGHENPRQADGSGPEVRAVFEGERRELFDSVVVPSDDEFVDLIDAASIRGDNGSQTRYFETEAHPGDGVIVSEMVILEETSGPLAGDGRPITDDPLGEHLPLGASRMLVVLDRESGRGVVYVSPSEISVNFVPHTDVVLDGRGGWPINIDLEPLHVDARPIVFGERSRGA